ncbi:type II toxin-antitoxin system HicB family antitoxin [Vibrio sonorensis]|uniref:type II toxin-antitoxin system HicB family antitoxin n=1 Tax=Vibrio sonorensis TaxID=1004316 RepID=UPI0008DADB51|nr:type II toxin-antitoxin system HicB family antitoxin [Vibrio sonorensis]
MLYPIAIETGEGHEAYGVVFPDLPGCFSAGDSLDEALINAQEAANFYLEDLAESGKLPPEASSLADCQQMKEYQGWAWAVIVVDIEPYMGKASKINVTLPNLLTKQIDNCVEVSTEYKSRSHFLQVAALHELSKASGV